jgi:hypothetical protein
MSEYFNDSYINKLSKINIAFSGGGMASFYQNGVCKHVTELYRNKQIDIMNIYGSSGGAFAGTFLVYAMYNPEVNWESFMNIVYSQFKIKYTSIFSRILPIWIDIYDLILPNDIHTLCTNRLHIAIMVKEKYGFTQKVISQYNSKRELLEIMNISASLPIFTSNSAFKLYECPESIICYPAIDGVFTPVINNTEYETLYVNILKHKYPLFKRIFYYKNDYDNMIREGYRDSNNLFYRKKETKILYIYDRGYNRKNKQYLYLLSNKILCLIVYLWFLIFT